MTAGWWRSPPMTTDLVAGVPGVRLAALAVKNGEVYIRDMTAGETALVSVGLSGGPAGARSMGPVVAGNGRFVAFYSNAQTLVDGDTGRTVDVFIRDFPPVPDAQPAGRGLRRRTRWGRARRRAPPCSRTRAGARWRSRG